MQANPFQRLWWGAFFHVGVGACCLGAGMLQAADGAKSSQDISAELERQTNVQAQLDRILSPLNGLLKQTAAGARGIKKRFAAGTPEYRQVRELYTRVGQALAKVELELTEAVKTVQAQDRGERASRANKQAAADLNDAVQSFNDFATRLVPTPPSEPPKGPAPSGEPAGPPTPPGFSMQPIQPEQYPQAQQAGLSPGVFVQVCNVFVVHALGRSEQSVDSLRQQMVRQIRSQALLPAFEGA
jgi:hypothetical protein